MSNSNPTEPSPPDNQVKAVSVPSVFKFLQPSQKSSSAPAQPQDANPSKSNFSGNDESESKSEPLSDPVTLAVEESNLGSGEVTVPTLNLSGGNGKLDQLKRDEANLNGNASSRPSTTAFAGENPKERSISAEEDSGEKNSTSNQEKNDQAGLGRIDSRIQIGTLEKSGAQKKDNEGESSSIPRGFASQSIYLQDDDREIDFLFFFQSRSKVYLWYFLCFLTVGVLYLVGKWVPKFFIWFTCKPVDAGIFEKGNENRRVRVGVKVSSIWKDSRNIKKDLTWT